MELDQKNQELATNSNEKESFLNSIALKIHLINISISCFANKYQNQETGIRPYCKIYFIGLRQSWNLIYFVDYQNCILLY